MSTTKTFAGASYNLPLNREPRSSSWGTEVSNFLIALADNAIPKTGGAYTLSAELNLGATYGVLAPYVKSAGTNIAAAGVVRLSKTETIGWRNNANGADLALAINASDQLTFGGVVLAATGTASIVNADISATAAIALTKLAAITAGSVLMGNASNAPTATALTGDVTVTSAGVTAIGATKVTNAMLAGSIAYSKLTLTGAILNADLAGSIAYSKLSLTGAIVNADLAAAVSIAKGGTGQVTAQAAIDALLPTQTSNSGKVLGTNGTTSSWVAGLSTTLASANLFVGNVSNVATAVAMTGDVSIDNAGATTIGALKVTNGMLAGSIAGSKIATVVPGTTSGVVSSSGLTGATAGAVIAAGFVGEVIESHIVATNSMTSNVSGDITTITLTAGLWDVYWSVYLERNAATMTNTLFICGITSTAGDNSPANRYDVRQQCSASVSSTFTNFTLSGVARVRSDGTNLVYGGVTATSTQIVRLKSGAPTFTGGPCNTYGSIVARRVA